MQRRQFIALIGGVVVAPPLVARAQTVLPPIGFLSGRSPDESADLVDAFAADLKDGGFVEGKNVAVESRWAQGDYARLPALAAELHPLSPAQPSSVPGRFTSKVFSRALIRP